MVRGQFGGRERQASSLDAGQAPGQDAGLGAGLHEGADPRAGSGAPSSGSAASATCARSMRPSSSSTRTAVTSRGPRRTIRRGALTPFRPPLRGLLLAALSLLPLLGSCTTGSPIRSGRSAYEPYAPSATRLSTASSARTRGAPAWRFRPLSWSKLADVETWLAAEGARADARTRVEAELVLAEGRLVFASRDL